MSERDLDDFRDLVVSAALGCGLGFSFTLIDMGSIIFGPLGVLVFGAAIARHLWRLRA